MKFTIDYSKWRAGGSGGNMIGYGLTRLLNDKGYMCCLGQCSLQLGVPESALSGLLAPSAIGFAHKGLVSIFTSLPGGDTSLCINAVEINDTKDLSQRGRINKLRGLFAEHGHELEFINVPEGV